MERMVVKFLCGMFAGWWLATRLLGESAYWSFYQQLVYKDGAWEWDRA